MATETETIRAGRTVTLPNGNRATVALVSGRSALVRVKNASAWYALTALKLEPA